VAVGNPPTDEPRRCRFSMVESGTRISSEHRGGPGEVHERRAYAASLGEEEPQKRRIWTL